MKVVSLLVVFVCLAVVVSGMYVTEKEYQREFSKYVKSFGKKYTTDEFFTRYEIFKSNLDLIELHNSRGETHTLGVNQFADMTSDEVASKYNGFRPSNKAKHYVPFNAAQEARLKSANANEFDWRTVGAVTDVKDQGQCGSCWSFSATGSVEGAVFLKTKKLISLSEQQLMDCSVAEGDNSCEGGLMDDAFQFILDNKGICQESDYPYVAKDEACKKTCMSVSTITGFADVKYDPSHPNDETALMKAVMVQPVSIAIEADQSVFQLYSGGVITSSACGTNLDHGVLIVGYGTDNKTNVDYWLVKNSWGNKWGEAGYVRLARNQNECGLNMMSSYPIA
jgi:C1A family cysteine protease